MSDETTEEFQTPEQVVGEQLTVQDILDEANQAEYHPILELFKGILSPARDQIGTRISPQWANKMVGSHAELTFKDLPTLAQRYYEGLGVICDILQVEIDSDDECLKQASAAEDVEHNGHHYANLLVEWQRQFLQWELEWDPTDDNAAVELAALSEIHKIVFGQAGITGLLDQINFIFTDGDRQFLADTLQEMMDLADGKEKAKEGGAGE